MSTRRIQCREHGGIFVIPAKRGRQPVRCGGEKYPPCSQVEAPSSQASQVAGEAIGRSVASRLLAAESNGNGSGGTNPSLALAKATKERLEAMGWAVKGRAWVDDERIPFAHIVASRGAETLVMEWQNITLIDQQYSLEFPKPQLNGVPEGRRQLAFNPDELTDRELVAQLAGMKVTWWNTLAGSTENAIIPGDKISIEHIFTGPNDADNAKRIVKFIDRGGHGFRAFHVGALMKVG